MNAFDMDTEVFVVCHAAIQAYFASRLRVEKPNLWITRSNMMIARVLGHIFSDVHRKSSQYDAPAPPASR